MLAEQVNFELNQHIVSEQQKTKRAIEELKKTVSKTEAIASIYGAVGSADLSHLDDHAIRTKKIVDRWRAAAIPISPSSNIDSRVLHRVTHAVTPSAPGKDSTKDCIIIETYLEAMRELRSKGNSRPMVFVSSNKKDYADTRGALAKPDLQDEFNILAVQYAPNMAAAKHFLGI